MDNLLTPKEHFHGSDLEKIEAAYGIKKENIISFSANVNPLGLSPNVCEQLKNNLSVISRYPDREYTELRKSIGKYCGTDYRNVIVGNGCTELISAVIKLLHPQNACLLTPTYSEYEHELTAAGSICHHYMLREENGFLPDPNDLLGFILTHSVNFLVLCNPNNPTSILLSHDLIADILRLCAEHGIFVMIDETYVEFAPDTPENDKITAVPLTDRFDNFIILRGTSKFFAAPGLRLGYAVSGNREMLEKIDEMKNPWPVNSVAEFAGKSLFQDTEYINNTRNLISSERKRVCEQLQKIDGLQVFPAAANFVLVKILKDNITADLLFDACIRQGLMIRDCSSFEGLSDKYFRICFMMPEDNDRLLDVIRRVMNS